MTKHTPGPWTTGVSIYKNMAGEIRAGDSGHAIAQVWKHENAYADARLIAAAPELLRSLVNLLTNAPTNDAISGCHPKRTSVDVRLYLQDILDARSAIAKAEGR